MTLTPRALETLIDLVENKLSMLEVFDRDDARELSNLQACLKELSALAGRPLDKADKPAQPSAVLSFPGRQQRSARPSRQQRQERLVAV